MSRPREFDEHRAVVAAAAIFREFGFAGTSIDRLVQATGVHRASLYAVFGSKLGLLIRVLEEADDLDPMLKLDLMLVALQELAPTQPKVRDAVMILMESEGTTAADLGHRLLTRALGSDEEPNQRNR